MNLLSKETCEELKKKKIEQLHANDENEIGELNKDFISDVDFKSIEISLKDIDLDDIKLNSVAKNM
jgi:hypothetical protein